MERLEEWQRMFLEHYHLDQKRSARRSLSFSTVPSSTPVEEEGSQRQVSSLAERYFQIALKLFYRALEKIFLIERKRSLQQQPNSSEPLQQALQSVSLSLSPSLSRCRCVF